MKKSRMKKWSALVLALLMLLSQIVAVSAEEPSSDDAEYELAVAAIMRDYWNDPEGTVGRLAELDTELVGEPMLETHHVEAGNMARETSPLDYTLSVYSFKRGNTSNYRLQWALNCNRTEQYPGALDFVSIEWDTECASYYSSSGDSTFSTVRGRAAGIVLFNLEDDNFESGDCAIGTIQVTPIVAGPMDYGAKFTHTYVQGGLNSSATTQFTMSANQSESLNLNYTYTYTVTTSQNTNQWTLWQDNTVTMHL